MRILPQTRPAFLSAQSVSGIAWEVDEEVVSDKSAEERPFENPKKQFETRKPTSQPASKTRINTQHRFSLWRFRASVRGLGS